MVKEVAMSIFTTIFSTLLLFAGTEASSLAKRDGVVEPPSMDLSVIGPEPECCLSKMVGLYNYTRVSIGYVPATCISNCIYTRVGAPGSRFCFARGPEEVHCLNEGGSPTTEVTHITTTIPPIRTELSFIEDGKTIKQSNSYHEDTGVLELNVPAHGNYSETQFIFNDEAGVLMKNSGTCNISPISKNYNAIDLHNGFEKAKERKVKQSDNQPESEQVNYHMKIRQQRVGYTERQKLHSAHSSACDDEPIVKSKDQSISKEQYEMIKAGMFVKVNQIITDPRSNRQGNESLTQICTTKSSPYGCARVFTKGNVKFNVHDITTSAICVTCCEDPNNCKQILGKTPCICSEITSSDKYVECVQRLTGPVVTSSCPVPCTTDCCNQNPTCCAGNDDGNDDGNGSGNGSGNGNGRWKRQDTQLVKQTLTFDKTNTNEYAIIVKSPSHQRYEQQLKEMTVILNTKKRGINNMMTKIGEDCQVMNLPSNMYPLDITIGLTEIKDTSVPKDDKDRYLANRELDNTVVSETLNSLVKEICKNGVKSTQQELIKKEDSEKLGNGGVILLEDIQRSRQVKSVRQNCFFKTKKAATEKASGDWRWPLPKKRGSGTKLFFHDITTTVNELQCCYEDNNDNTCSCDDANNYGLCKCSDITDQNTYKQCADFAAKFQGKI